MRPATPPPIAALLVALLAAVGCQDRSPEVKPDTSATTQPATGEEGGGEVAPNAPAPELAEAAPQLLKGSPLDEELHTFRLVWKGEPGDLTLHEEPRASSPTTGNRPIEAGQELAWEESVVVVNEPLYVTAPADRQLPGATPVGQGADKGLTVDVPAGQKVGIFKYAGEGTCVLSFPSGPEGLFYSVCPDPADWEAEGWDGKPRAKDYDWWVKLAPPFPGWVRVDGTNLVGELVERMP